MSKLEELISFIKTEANNIQKPKEVKNSLKDLLVQAIEKTMIRALWFFIIIL